MESQVKAVNDQLYSMRTSPLEHNPDVMRLEKENQTLREKFSLAFKENQELTDELDKATENIKKLEWALLQVKRQEL